MNKTEIKNIVTLKPKKTNKINIYETDLQKVTNHMELLNALAIGIKQQLKDGIDYGLIPQCGKKPSLFKSGAQKICLLYRLVAKFERTKDIQDRDKSYIQIEYSCSLYNEHGVEIAQGIGIETSDEKKHKNVNPFSVVNTIAKMAKKRALVDAVLMIGNLSEVFTQDVEDLKPVENKANQLTKDEKLNLYSTTYDKFKNLNEWMNHKLTVAEWKEKVKQHVFKVELPELGINKTSFLQFDSDDAEKYLQWLNNYQGVQNVTSTNI